MTALVVTAGLPGSGKSVLAQAVGIALGCAVIAVDTVEIGMRRARVGLDQPIGLASYGVTQAIAEDELVLGHSMVVDAVNAEPESRAVWTSLARAYAADLVVVEVVCSDVGLWRSRVENRRDKVPAVTWDQVVDQQRTYRPWTQRTLVADTATEDLSRLTHRVLDAVHAAVGSA